MHVRTLLEILPKASYHNLNLLGFMRKVDRQLEDGFVERLAADCMQNRTLDEVHSCFGLNILSAP
jgi:hypothetical protein